MYNFQAIWQNQNESELENSIQNQKKTNNMIINLQGEKL